jgi:sulfonate dioxygenase
MAQNVDDDRQKSNEIYDINVPYHALPEEYEKRIQSRTEFPQYLPSWEQGVWHDDYPIFDFHDPALRADKKKPNLLHPEVVAEPVTARMGTILRGVNLKTLSNEAKDELALLICERKFVVLRDQLDFLQAGPQFQVDFMEHYGKLAHHPVTGSLKGFPQFHIIHRDGNEDEIEQYFKQKMTTAIWHHDLSYLKQPPGYSMLANLACPDVGGDTVIVDMAMAYKRLSPVYQQMLEQLRAIHSSENLIAHANKTKAVVRADPVSSSHPVVRVHPVTGEKAIFINEEWVKEIIGLKDLEAESVTKFLMDQARMGHDFQARVQWKKYSVVIIDGRTTMR